MDGRAPLPHRRRRRLATTVVALAAALALASPARALADDDGDPSVRWPTDGPAVQTALAVAEGYWGMVPCQGEVTIWWEDLDPTVDAQAVWDNPIGQYAAPSRNTECEISLNPQGQWDWPKLCTIVVHEVGHLAGHDHVADTGDVMYFSFRQPLRQCLAVPEPAAGPGAPAEPEPAAAPATPARRGATPPAKARTTPARAARPRPAAKQRAKTARRGAAKRRSARPPARRHRTGQRR